jgi:hypothetical protein
MSIKIPQIQNINNQKCYFTDEEREQLSKLRIIQKNLVHFQGFPDRLYNKELLYSREYFGQYGEISKIILTNKFDKKSNKKSNSAYLTFATSEQAAYAILSVDSIKIDNQLVRAFFGTTKYCNHFLNNFKCFNTEKCMFLHYIADQRDIIAENIKFGYSEHIKLAKKIIEFGSIRSRLYVINNANNYNSILPNIVTIYKKDDILLKTQNHRRKKSNRSEKSLNKSNNSINNVNDISQITTRSSSKSSKSFNDEIKDQNKKNEFFNENNTNIINSNKLYESRNHSRFDFVNINMNINENCNNNKMIQDLINELTSRLAFFIQFSKNISMDLVEMNFCQNLYKNNNNNELGNLIEKSY